MQFPEMHLSSHYAQSAPEASRDYSNFHHSISSTPLQTEPPKRRRDGCTECRRKKIKCDLATPVCSRCARYPQECRYVSRFIAMRGEKSKTRRDAQRRKIGVKSQQQQQQSLTEPDVRGELKIEIETGKVGDDERLSVATAPSSYMSRIQAKMSIQAIVSETTTVVFPLASRSFLDRLLSSAMETPHLLFALLASSDSHARRRRRRRLASSSRPDDTALDYTNSAIAGLRAALSDERNAARSVEMAMTAMALCTNDVCNGNLDLFRVHLAGVRGMLLSGLLNGKRDSFAMYLFKWFAALDVSAGLSLFHKSNLLSGELYQSCRAALCASGDEGVDDICGYSLDLLPILAEVGGLARRRYTHPDDSEILRHSKVLEGRIAALDDCAATGGGQATAKGTELHTTHVAFIHTALLHLHRRVFLLPKTHPIVRTDVRNILDTLRSVRPTSTANILLLWPIFSAGCETDEVSERDIVDERMSIMQGMGMGNFTRARNILIQFWASKTTLRWDLWLAEQGVDLVLF